MSIALRPPCHVTVPFRCFSLVDRSRASRISSLVCSRVEGVVLVRGPWREGVSSPFPLRSGLRPVAGIG